MSRNQHLTAVIADDGGAMRDKIASIIFAEVEVVAAVCDGEEAVKAIQNFKPDIAILDIVMPAENGIAAARRLRRMGSSIPIVFLSVQDDPEYIEAAKELGASYVFKSRMHSDLVLAIRETLAGRIFTSKPDANRIFPE